MQILILKMFKIINDNWLEAFLKKKELLFLLFLLGGYVIVTSLPNLFGVNSRFFSVPYRFLVFLYSVFLLYENRNRIKALFKIVILFTIFWFFYFIKTYYSFQNDYYLNEFLKQENEIYVRIFILNLFPCLALVSINFQKIDFKLFCRFLFWIFFIALTFNFLYTIFYLNNFNKVSGVFSVYYISSGHFGASLVILSSYLLMFKTEEKIINKRLLFLGLFLGLFAIFISAARSPLLAIVVVGFYFIYLKRKVKYIYLFFMLLLICVAFLFISKQLLHLDSAFVDRNYVAIFEGNSSGREYFFFKSFSIIKNNLGLGGRVLYEDGMYPHNIFLELLMSGGMMLLTVFSLIFYPLIRKLGYFFKFSNSKFYLLLIFAFWIQYFILVQTSYNIHCNVEFWYFSSVVIGISINIYNEKIKSNDGSRNPSRNYTAI